MILRDETASDIDTVSAVTEAAFRTLQISRHTEQFIVKALRNAGALSLSLVAEDEGQVLGHIAFSPVAISDGSTDWYGLGPLSVSPDHQGLGIGTSLVTAGLARLHALGAKGCVLIGHPGFYSRLGFAPLPALRHERVPPEFFLALPFGEEVPRGTVVFHESFMANSDPHVQTRGTG